MSFGQNHIIHHLIIIGILLLGFSSLVFLSADKGLQIIAVTATALIYLGHGILHHYLEHDLTLKIVVEYILIALLTLALFSFVLGGI